MGKKEGLMFPKDFFKQSRPKLKIKESLKGNEPFKWSDEVIKNKTKVKIVSLDKNS